MHVFCKYLVMGAQPMVMKRAYMGVTIQSEEGEPVTEILEVCKVCGNPRTRTLAGRWTLEQLTGGK